jgi:hypothetical protein
MSKLALKSQNQEVWDSNQDISCMIFRRVCYHSHISTKLRAVTNQGKESALAPQYEAQIPEHNKPVTECNCLMGTAPTRYLECSDVSDFCLEDQAADPSETSEPISKITQSHIPEGIIITAV